MATPVSTRTTVTLPTTVYRALKVRAAETDQTVSGLIEDAVKYQIMEDLEDTEAVRKRAKEPTRSGRQIPDRVRSPRPGADRHHR